MTETTYADVVAYFDESFGDNERTCKRAINIYHSAYPEIYMGFKFLTSEQQMTLLRVPARDRARFNEMGLDDYLYWKKSGSDGHPPINNHWLPSNKYRK